MSQQNYEDYWKLTLAFTDYNGDGFLSTLRTCVNFIDRFNVEAYSPAKYSRLQTEINGILHIDFESVRKAINQLVKLGFVNSHLVSYHQLAKDYLSATTNRKRETLFSKIVYSNSSFNRSVKNESNLHQLNFLINTLVETGSLTKSEIIALMLVDISEIENGYLTKDELAVYLKTAQNTGFIERKYNQIGYLLNLLTKLDGVVFVNDELYFTEDAKRIFGEEIEVITRKRNPYLHLLYKNQLKEESFSIFQQIKCMVERLAYPVLIASHIKPFANCDDIEGYDANNGFLLSKNIDSLFDLGYITFENNGNIRFANALEGEVRDFISNYSLDINFLNEKRLEYLDFHRENVFERRFRS